MSAELLPAVLAALYRLGRLKVKEADVARERFIEFRGEDHTIVLDRDGNWSIYRGGDNDELTDLTEKERDYINDWVYDWRAGN